MTKAPSIKEALEFYADPFAWKKKHDLDDVVRIPDFYDETSFGDTAKTALATLKPSGERREALATAFAKKFPAVLAQHSQYKIVDWFLASGLVQNEADIRASDLADRLCTGKAAWPLACHSPNSCSRHERCMYFHCIHQGEDISAAIRSAINEDLK